MSSILPANLSFFMSRLQGVSTSRFKVNPQTDGVHRAGKIIRFELPSNTLVNLRSIVMMGNWSSENSASGTTTGLTNNLSSSIERLAVYMGGVLVQNGFQQYNTLVHAKAAVAGSKCGSLAHPEICRKKSYHNNTALTDDNNEAYADEDDRFAIDHFEGLLSTIEPSIIDTGLIGNSPELAAVGA